MIKISSRNVFSPSPFQGLQLSQKLPPVDSVSTLIEKGASREDLVREAGRVMIETGQKIVVSLRDTYEKHKSTGNWWLAEAAASGLTLLGPTGVAFDVWWQSKRANQAVAELQGIGQLASNWALEMSEKWLPTFLDEIEKVDPSLAVKVDETFDQVVVEYGKVSDLMAGVKLLPTAVITNSITTFFSNLWESIKKMGRTLFALAEALGGLVESARKVTEQFPTVVVVGGLALIAYLIFKN